MATKATGRRSLCSKPAILRSGEIGGRGPRSSPAACSRRRGSRDRFRRDVAAGAAAVLDHDALLHTGIELARHQAADDVGEPAGRNATMTVMFCDG